MILIWAADLFILKLEKMNRISSIFGKINPAARQNLGSLRNFSAAQSTIFDKIISREIPAEIVYEDSKILAFRDIMPQAPVHILIIPKQKDGLSGLGAATSKNAEILGHMMVKCASIADQLNLKDGFRIVINDGKQGCQSVDHIHIHLLGGAQLSWPPGTPGPDPKS
jgi:diadenosine tetraphosphate (Ap4A) HIT family hydrolase